MAAASPAGPPPDMATRSRGVEDGSVEMAMAAKVDAALYSDVALDMLHEIFDGEIALHEAKRRTRCVLNPSQ